MGNLTANNLNQQPGKTANVVTIVILSRGNCGLSKCVSVYMVAMATADLLVMTFDVIVYRMFNYRFPYSFMSHIAVSNLVSIVILSRGNCSLSKCISVYMVSMATADLLVIIFNVIVSHILNYQFPNSFLSFTSVCKFTQYMNSATLETSVWFTVLFTFDRFVVICWERLKTKYCTKRTASAVIITVSVLICLKNIPISFSYEPERIINNELWGCLMTVDFLTLPAWAVYNLIRSITVPWLPFMLMALLNSLTVRRILLTSRARRAIRGKDSENQADSEMENRKKSIILLFTISGSFILLWTTAAVTFLTTRVITTVYYHGDCTSPAYIATETGLMLMYLSSCTNTCIYAATQRKFREELKIMVNYPWTLILRSFKQ
ncbi:probable G-protein coupled receptor 139 [Heptranchias perlo]|uniref:probable G-protein coupled receptor 139 n=1 Tax=Heptranchias perlo TaxID=212740 RepID=UPI00355963A7